LSRRLLVAGLVLGALLRVAALPLPGMEDMLTWKIWSHAAAHDPTAIYGVGGSPPERRVLRWRGQEITAEYPPMAIDELALVGRLYREHSPDFEDSTALTMAIKLPGLVADVVLVALLLTWGRRVLGNGAAVAALIYWLNPAIILNGAALGYLDPQMAVPVVLSLVAIVAGRPALAGALFAMALLTKPQPLVVAPVLVVAMLTHAGAARWRALVAAASGGGIAAAMLLTPVVVRGAWANMVQAVSRMGAHDMLSGQSANVWWILTYVLRVMDVWEEWGPRAAIGQKLRILGISRAIALGYPNARLVGFSLLAIVIGVAVWLAWRHRGAAMMAALCGWCAWAYALVAPQAHENHLFLAVPFFCLAAGLDRRFRAVCWTVSAIAALNMYFFNGLGTGWDPVPSRTATFVDSTVLLSVVNVSAFVALAWRSRKAAL
jgi:hypothetical protein